MDHDGTSDAVGNTKQPKPSGTRDGNSRPIPPRRPSGLSRRKSSAKYSTPRTRTSNACEGCRKRKTKCSGPPGPCGICVGFDATCIFRSKSHTRRKHAHDPDTAPEKQKYLLDGIFLILKHNTPEDVQTLVQLIRNEAQPEKIFHCIRVNLRFLQERGLTGPCDVDDQDFYALAPSTLQQSRVHRKDNLQDESIKDISRKAESWSTEPDAPSSTAGMTQSDLSGKQDLPSPTQPGTWKIPERPPTYNNPDEFFEAMGIDELDLPSGMHLEEAASSETGFSSTLNSQAQPFMERFFRHPINSAEHIAASIPNPLSTLAISTSTGLPVSAPESALDHFTLAFINYAHQLMSTGTTLNELNNFGIPNCELLFRNRESDDRFTIPNWACETARQFPTELLPTTRIALALCLMRVIPYMICPSPETLHALPGMLRPTDLQKRLAHRIEHNFIPFPKLRDCVIDHSTSSSPAARDWIVQLADHTCRVGWSGLHTDIAMDTLRTASPEQLSTWTEETHRRWACEQQILIMQQLSMQERDSHPFDDARQAEIIVRDLKTGECHISGHFERACWTYENWSLSKTLLNVWPEFSGHIKVH